MTLAHYGFDGDGVDAVSSRVLRIVGASFVSGVSGLALSFDGTSSQFAMRTADDDEFDLMSGDFTLSLWFLLDEASATQTLIEKLGGAIGPGWSLRLTASSALEFSVDGALIAAPAAVREGRWHHVAIRREGRLYALFFDGAVLFSSAGPTVLNGTTSPLTLARRNVGATPSEFFKGRLDELTLVGRALSDAELRREYNDRAP